MIIISLNINDFGGTNEHLACHKKTNYYGKEVTDWNSWKKVSKTYVINKLKDLVLQKKPTVFILGSSGMSVERKMP